VATPVTSPLTAAVARAPGRARRAQLPLADPVPGPRRSATSTSASSRSRCRAVARLILDAAAASLTLVTIARWCSASTCSPGRLARPIRTLKAGLDEIAAGRYDFRIADKRTRRIGGSLQGLRPHGCRARGSAAMTGSATIPPGEGTIRSFAGPPGRGRGRVECSMCRLAPRMPCATRRVGVPPAAFLPASSGWGRRCSRAGCEQQGPRPVDPAPRSPRPSPLRPDGPVLARRPELRGRRGATGRHAGVARRALVLARASHRGAIRGVQPHRRGCGPPGCLPSRSAAATTSACAGAAQAVTILWHTQLLGPRADTHPHVELAAFEAHMGWPRPQRLQR